MHFGSSWQDVGSESFFRSRSGRCDPVLEVLSIVGMCVGEALGAAVFVAVGVAV